jgi:hypothetical protein
MKRGAESVEDEKKNIERLCDACRFGTLEDVTNALESCDVNVVRADGGKTPLMYACERDHGKFIEGSKEIVALLLKRGALINATTFKGTSVLSQAVAYSSPEIVDLLIENKAFVNSTNHKGLTPLHLCASKRCDEEGMLICAKLVGSGADIRIAYSHGYTAFHAACRFNTLGMVQFLCQEFKKCVTKLTDIGTSVLMFACTNNMYGPEIIEYLITVQKLDVFQTRPDNRIALNIAVEKSGLTTKALVKHINCVPIGQRKGFVIGWINGPDPMLAYKAGLQVGCKLSPCGIVGDFKRLFKEPDTFWAGIRVRCVATLWTPIPLPGATKQGDFSSFLSQKEVPERVRDLLLPEILVARFGTNHDTLLHMYARQNDVVGLMSVMKQGVCPFIRNVNLETPMDIAIKAQSTQIIRCLTIYSRWYPDEQRTRWYGPYFRKRAKTFLLVAQRLRIFPRDISTLIVRYIADCEEV